MNEIVPNEYNEKVSSETNEQKIEVLFSDFQNAYDTAKLREMLPEIYDQEGFGQSKFHRFDVLNHSREALKNYHNELIVPTAVVNHLEAQKIEELSKSILLELAIVFHDAGKKIVKETAGRMRGHEIYTVNNQLESVSHRFGLSQSQKEYLRDLIYYHHSHNETDTDTQIAKLIQDKDLLLGILILRIVDLLATQGAGVPAEEMANRTKFLSVTIQNLFYYLPNKQ